MSEHSAATAAKHEALAAGDVEKLLAAHASPEHSHEELEKAKHEQAEQLHKASNEVEDTAVESHALLRELEKTEDSPAISVPQRMSKQLEQITLKRELKGIRRKLRPSERPISAFMHQPVVRVVSETAGKTVTRPSGLLGGGVTALTGTTIYLYMAKHIGFTYNYGVFLALFVAGFAIGLVVELAVHMATASRRIPS